MYQYGFGGSLYTEIWNDQFPGFFEDGAYIMHSDKIDFNMVKQKFMQNGLKVVNIHPMHFALNTPYISVY